MTEPSPRVGLFVTCLVDLFRPTRRLCRDQAHRGHRLQRRCADGADLLRPAGLQFRRPRRRSRHRRKHHPRLRGLRLRRRALGLLRRHAEEALSRPVQGRSANGRARAVAFAAKVHELVSFLVDVRGATGVSAQARGHRHLSRFLLGPARARHPGAAARGCSPRSTASNSSRCRTRMSAAASAARSA